MPADTVEFYSAYCTSKEVRDLLRIEEVLTFDGHFEQMGSVRKP